MTSLHHLFIQSSIPVQAGRFSWLIACSRHQAPHSDETPNREPKGSMGARWPLSTSVSASACIWDMMPACCTTIKTGPKQAHDRAAASGVMPHPPTSTRHPTCPPASPSRNRQNPTKHILYVRNTSLSSAESCCKKEHALSCLNQPMLGVPAHTM